jgi:hypothetical protein
VSEMHVFVFSVHELNVDSYICLRIPMILALLEESSSVLDAICVCTPISVLTV